MCTIIHQSAHLSSFERRAWTLIEIEAINLFTETLPQYRIWSCWEKAFESIVMDYSRVSSPRHDQFDDIHGSVHDSNITTDNRFLQASASMPVSCSLEDSQVSRKSPATAVVQSPNCTSTWESDRSHKLSTISEVSTTPASPSGAARARWRAVEGQARTVCLLPRCIKNDGCLQTCSVI